MRKTGITREKLMCARDYRWHVWCANCDKCVGHGTVEGLRETPPRRVQCCGAAKLIDTEARED